MEPNGWFRAWLHQLHLLKLMNVSFSTPRSSNAHYGRPSLEYGVSCNFQVGTCAAMVASASWMPLNDKNLVCEEMKLVCQRFDMVFPQVLTGFTLFFSFSPKSCRPSRTKLYLRGLLICSSRGPSRAVPPTSRAGSSRYGRSR